MSRLMSVAYTEEAVRARRKTVTRRKGWLMLKPGDHLTLCRKVMGRKKGEPLVRVAEVEVVSVRRESLMVLFGAQYGPTYRYFAACDEVSREGFPGLRPSEFVRRYFIDAQGMQPTDEVTRIEFRYLDEVTP